MTIAGAVFDKDGTLFDFHSTWSVWAADTLRALGSGDTSLTSALADALEYDLEARRFRPTSFVIAGTVGEQADALAPLLPHLSRTEIIDQMNERAAAVKQVETVPLGQFLEGLKQQGLKLGVATNDAESSARVHLESVGALAQFDFLAGYDSGYGAKPEPGQLLAFAEACKLDPSEVVMVGDSTHDLISARAAGMVAVGVLTGPADEATLAPEAEVVLPSIAELPAWIATHRNQ